MKRIGLITTLLLLLSACAGNGASGTGGADQQYTLRLNLKPGQQWTTITTQTQHQDITAPADPSMSQSVAVTSTSTMDYNVLDVDAEGNTVMSLVTTGIRADTTANGRTQHTDSATDSVPGSESAFLLNQPLTMTVTPQGIVTKYAGVDEAITNIFTSMAGGEAMPDGFNAEMQPVSEKLKASLKQMMGMNAIYPDQPVEIGDSWTRSVSLDMLVVTMDLNLTYTLREVTSDGLVIELHGVGKVSPASAQDSKLGEMAEHMQMDMTLTQDGEIVLDPETYWIIRQHYTQVMQGTVTMDDSVGRKLQEVDQALSDEGSEALSTPEADNVSPQSMTIPMKQTMTMDMQVQK